MANTAGGQHGGVPVDRLVGLAIGDLFVVEPDEHLVGVAGGAVLKHLADGGLGRRARPESGDHPAQDGR
jgi:hypothetical protein